MRKLAVLLACMAWAGAAAAQAPAASPVAAAPADPARLAAAQRLIDLMHLDATLDRMFAQLTPVFAQGVIGAMSGGDAGRTLLGALDAKPDGRTRFEAILSQEFLASLRRQYPALKQGLATEYAATFTLDELQAIAAFYQTGPGAKLLRLQPDLQQRMAVRGQALGRTAGEEAGVRAVERATREILGRTERPAT